LQAVDRMSAFPGRRSARDEVLQSGRGSGDMEWLRSAPLLAAAGGIAWEEVCMPAPDDFAQLIKRLEAGDPEAAAVVHDRYVRRLIGLARRQLDPRFQARVDQSDIAQSVFRTFFRRQAERPFDLGSEDALWALLAEITMRKCGRWNEHFHARKRSVEREVATSTDLDGPAGPTAGGEPSPEDAAMLRDTVEQLLAGLDPRSQRVCELRLQGYEIREIAEQLDCTQVTVQRKLKLIKERLRGLCPPGGWLR
jgi:RNA polymerase sigma-70 factor (ECF subfamily)